MNRNVLFGCIAFLTLQASTSTRLLAETAEERQVMQEKLDNACEQAREDALRPIREQYVQECVQKGDMDRAACERFYADYGDANTPVGQRFYDLPECVKAFDYRGSYRGTD